MRLLPLEDALEEFEKPLADIFDEGIEAADNRFVVWHYASWSHGAFLMVPAGLEIAEPFLIDFTERGAGVLSSPHVAVVLGEGARASVVQRIAGDPAAKEERILCNAGLDLSLADAAALQYYEAQELGPQSLYFRHARTRSGRDSSLRHFDAALGGKLVKTRIDCGLAGREARHTSTGSTTAARASTWTSEPCSATTPRRRQAGPTTRAPWQAADGPCSRA